MLGLAGGTTLSTAVAIGQSELQARIWYPKVYKGWSLARRYRFEYEQYPRRVLYAQWLDISSGLILFMMNLASSRSDMSTDGIK